MENNTNRSKGRPKGSPNAITKESRKLFNQILAGEIDNIKEAFDQVREQSPAKYLTILSKYLPFFIPKMTELELKGEDAYSFDFNDVMQKLRGDD